MAIHDLFSKRKAAAERTDNDVYSYNDIPSSVRSQLRQMYHEAYENYLKGKYSVDYFRLDDDGFDFVVKALRREYGRDSLIKYCQSMRAELYSFLDECTTDEFLDCAEIYARLVSSSRQLEEKIKKRAIFELNYRFREAGLGYEFVDTKIIRIDSLVLHAEVLKPTMKVLSSNSIYIGAEQEIIHAFEKFRSHDNKGAVTDALKAFESTMKAILDKRGWAYNPNDSAAKLIAACFNQGLIPAYLQTHFGALKTMLESGVPTIRNKTSGHGQGASVKPLDDHFASYVLYTALANMKLLIDCDKALP